MDLMIACAVFLLFASAGLILASRQSSTSSVAQRLDDVTHASASAADELLRPAQRSRAAGGLLSNLPRLDLIVRLERSMWQAGMYSKASSILLLMGALLATGAGLAMLISQDVEIALAVGFALALTPLLYIRMRRRRRLRDFLLQFPYALDLIKSSLEAGHTLQRGMQVVEREFTDPLGGEFRAVLEQTRLGMPLNQALAEMLRRVPEDDLRLFVVAVKVQSEVGSSLAQIIARLSEIVRTRQRLFSQIRSLTAQSRMSGMVVGLLPVAVLGLFALIQPCYTEMLFFDRTGKLILKTAMGLDLGALLLIRHILRVNF
jgi:tight adherence protein B